MIEIRNLSNFILNNINLSIKKGDLFVLLGPNGAGKTTLLNVIAGFYDYTGTITINDKSIEKVPIEKRHIGYVFQDLFLFPHLTVYENIAFGLKVQKKKYKKTVEELLNLLNLRELSYRYPSHLSGGEKQKVALARVLAINPKIILMDEPFSNLDPTTAKYLRDELKQIQKSTGITTLYVTHDQSDAMALADRVAVMNEGRIIQVGSPDDIFRKPNSEFVANFVGVENLFKGKSIVENGSAHISIDGVNIFSTNQKSGEAFVSVRPEEILISKQSFKSSARNSLKGKIAKILNSGATVKVTVDAGIPFNVMITKQSLEDMELKEGTTAYITFKAAAVHIF